MLSTRDRRNYGHTENFGHTIADSTYKRKALPQLVLPEVLLEVLHGQLVASEADRVSRESTHHTRSEAREESLHTTFLVQLGEGRCECGVLTILDEVVSLHCGLGNIDWVNQRPVEQTTDTTSKHQLPCRKRGRRLLARCKPLLALLIETKVHSHSDSVTDSSCWETLEHAANAMLLNNVLDTTIECVEQWLLLEHLGLKLCLEEVNRRFYECNEGTGDCTGLEKTRGLHLARLRICEHRLDLAPNAELPGIEEHLTPERGSDTFIESTEALILQGFSDAITEARVDGVGCRLSLQTDFLNTDLQWSGMFGAGMRFCTTYKALESTGKRCFTATHWSLIDADRTNGLTAEVTPKKASIAV